MKYLIMIIHSDIQRDLADQLQSMKEIETFIFCAVESHRFQVESDQLLSARDKVVGYIDKIKVEILLNDKDINKVLTEIREKVPGLVGNTHYWVTDIFQHGEI